MMKVLFVDNDPVATQKLKKMLNAMCPEWQIEVSVSGEEALNIMSKSPYDVIVSDLRIQGMDGIELLETVSERHPETVRIIHSESFRFEINHDCTPVFEETMFCRDN